MADDRSRAQRSVDWQNKYLTPILLVIGIILVAGSWAVGAITWWLGLAIVVLGVFALVGVLRRNRRSA